MHPETHPGSQAEGAMSSERRAEAKAQRREWVACVRGFLGVTYLRWIIKRRLVGDEYGLRCVGLNLQSRVVSTFFYWNIVAL